MPTARDLFGLLLAADALGGTERVLDRTVAYAKDRQAFGRAIGGFQAVQHRLADHAVRVRGMSLAGPGGGPRHRRTRRRTPARRGRSSPRRA